MMLKIEYNGFDVVVKTPIKKKKSSQPHQRFEFVASFSLAWPLTKPWPEGGRNYLSGFVFGNHNALHIMRCNDNFFLS